MEVTWIFFSLSTWCASKCFHSLHGQGFVGSQSLGLRSGEFICAFWFLQQIPTPDGLFSQSVRSTHQDVFFLQVRGIHGPWSSHIKTALHMVSPVLENTSLRRWVSGSPWFLLGKPWHLAATDHKTSFLVPHPTPLTRIRQSFFRKVSKIC